MSAEISNDEQYIVKNITAFMFIPNKPHLQRLEMFGKKLSENTVLQKRHVIELINEKFGECYINKLKLSEVEQFLINDCHSGSWKNFFLETLGAVYDETQWVCEKPVLRPPFKKFYRNSRKADILTSEELRRLFLEKNWKRKQSYLCFLIAACCGLRLGEARALQLCQFDFDRKILVVDGFCKENGFKTCYNKGGSIENRKLRITPLPDDLIIKIKDFVKNSVHLSSEKDYLFFNGKRIISKSILYKDFKNAVQKSKIPTENRKICPHSLRFTYVTRMRRSVPIEQVQKIVGHSSANMTEYYSRFGVEELFESIKTSFPAVNNLFN